MRWSIPARGVRIGTTAPSTVSVPLSEWSAPKSSRASSVRPDPSRPASPTTSPWRISSENGATAPFLDSPSAWRNTGAAARSDRSCADSSRSSRTSSSLPIILVTSSTGVMSEVRYSPTSFPLRSTVIRSAIAKTWSMKCDTNRIAIPSSRSDRSTLSSCSTSPASRLDVGSSSTSTRADTSSARAIATICCTAIDWEPSPAETSSRRSSAPSRTSARRLMPAQWMRPNLRGSRPMKMFSATERFGQRFTSW